MAVPTDITDISTTAGSNSPLGTEAIGTSLDDYLRSIQAILKQTVSKGADIASGNTITIPNSGSYFVVTGTTTIAGINDAWNGRVVYLKFSGALTLTSSASLILFGADITTASGDSGIFVNESSGVWRCLAFTASTTGTYITASSTETLTNKTLVVANNTITTAASGNLAATELNAALAELDSDKADKISGGTTGALIEQDASGNLVDTGVAIGDLATDAELTSGLATKSETSHNHSGVYEPADATILKDADIGVSVAAQSHTHSGYATTNASSLTSGTISGARLPLTIEAVGTYTVATCSTNVSSGATTSATYLSGISSGTWRNMEQVNVNGTEGLFLRIS